MRRPWGRRRRFAATVALALIPFLCGRVSAATTCTVSDIEAVEPNCPADPAQPCRILSKIAAPAGVGCDLDLTGRDLIIGSLDGPGGSLGSDTIISILAKSLTIHANGSIDGRGDGARGADLMVNVDGAVALLRKGAQAATIDVSNSGGAAGANTLSIKAGGAITIDGLIRSGKQLHALDDTDGTELSIESASEIIGIGEVLAPSGDGDGSYVSLYADGRIDFGGRIDAHGWFGGSVDAAATGDARLHDVNVAGTAAAAYGGDVGLSSDEGDVSLTGDVDLRAIGVNYDEDGGIGGILQVDALKGSISIGGDVQLGDTAINGEGGVFHLNAAVDIALETGSLLSVAAGNSGGHGGHGYLSAGRDLQVRGALESTGRSTGGTIEADAGRHLIVDGAVDVGAPAGDDYASGGDLDLRAGGDGTGHLLVHGQIDANGGGCLYGSISGSGGSVDLGGCDVTVGALARVRACGRTGGSIGIVGRHVVTVAGEVRAPNVGLPGSDGTIEITHPESAPPVLALGTVDPAAHLVPRVACTAANTKACLMPCPECGDGVVAFPETCDTLGTPVSCDGCSSSCRLEEPNCDDGRSCTVDSCNPLLSCQHERIYPCHDCMGDVNRDGIVDGADFTAVASAINRCGGVIYGCKVGPQLTFDAADFDHSLTLTAADVSHMAANRMDPSLPNGCVP